MRVKDPHAVLDFPFNWSAWLIGADTISAHVITADVGITVDSDSESAGIVTVWLSGGTVGTIYNIACWIHTAAGRKDERTIQIMVEDR